MIDNAWAVPKMKICGVSEQTSFSVEYTAKSGIYIGTKISAFYLSEVVEKILEDNSGRAIGRMLITPLPTKETVCDFKMLNSCRI